MSLPSSSFYALFLKALRSNFYLIASCSIATPLATESIHSKKPFQFALLSIFVFLAGCAFQLWADHIEFKRIDIMTSQEAKKRELMLKNWRKDSKRGF